MMEDNNRDTESDSTLIDVILLNGLDTRLRFAIDFGASFVISGLLAVMFRTLTAPLERIKLILQTQRSSHQMQQANRSLYSGILNTLIRIPKEQGFLSLWRGNFISICRYFPSQAINFSFYELYYEIFQNALESRMTNSHIVLPFLTGGAVGVTSSTIIYPLTFCNTRISVDVGDNKTIKREFNGLTDCLRKVYKSDGLRGFYQGLSLAVCGLSLYRSIYFGIYTFGKRVYLNDLETDSPAHNLSAPFFVSLTIAQSSSFIATVIAYPLDTLSRQKMLWSGRGMKSYVTIRQLAHTILEKDGPIGFYRGVTANLLTSICGACVLVTYDLIKSHYNRIMEPKKSES